MTETPPRKRFQIHLSTAMVMMFVAGAFIWVNVTRRTVRYGDGVNTSALVDIGYGWPLLCVYDEHLEKADSKGTMVVTIPPKSKVMWGVIFFSASVAFWVLVIVWRYCESLIRRRAARKEA